ncbi:MAG: radical SAM protein [Candidatus Omnitrophica bacterium]|nr:radical SAM protein [Candidatus Omnitrophota bacterium]
MKKLHSMAKYLRMAKAYLCRDLPTHMVFFVTARCNAQCGHCFYRLKIKQAAPAEELSLNEIGMITRELPGLVQMSLTGGEPFLREDLGMIMRHFYTNAKTRFFTISTNGSLPEAVDKVLREILPLTPEAFYRISISFDDIGERHDQRRMIPGLTEKVGKTVAIVNRLKTEYPQLTSSMVTTMDRDNQADLKAILAYLRSTFPVDDWGVGLIRGNPYEPAKKNVDLRYYREFQETIDEPHRSSSWISRQIAKVIRYEYPLKIRILEEKKQIVPCVAGRRMIVLRENGDVDACETLDSFLGISSSMGNVKEHGYSLKALLSSDKARSVRDFIRQGTCYCTYECALHCSVFYNPSELLKLLFRRTRGRSLCRTTSR